MLTEKRQEEILKASDSKRQCDCSGVEGTITCIGIDDKTRFESDASGGGAG